FFFFSSRRRHTRSKRDWSSDVCAMPIEVTGDTAPCWKKRNVTVKVITIYGRNVASCQTNENVPINNNDDTVPVNPVNSNGRRPTLPNNQIPINVAKTEITPLEI